MAAQDETLVDALRAEVRRREKNAEQRHLFSRHARDKGDEWSAGYELGKASESSGHATVLKALLARFAPEGGVPPAAPHPAPAGSVPPLADTALVRAHRRIVADLLPPYSTTPFRTVCEALNVGPDVLASLLADAAAIYVEEWLADRQREAQKHDDMVARAERASMQPEPQHPWDIIGWWIDPPPHRRVYVRMRNDEVRPATPEEAVLMRQFMDDNARSLRRLWP